MSARLKGIMTPDEVARMKVLCQMIALEKNHDKFLELVKELNDLLERKEKRLDHHPAS